MTQVLAIKYVQNVGLAAKHVLIIKHKIVIPVLMVISWTKIIIVSDVIQNVQFVLERVKTVLNVI